MCPRGGGGGGGGGGGHSGTEGGRTRVTYFAEEGVFLKTSACPRQRIIKSKVKIHVPVHPMSGVFYWEK